MIASRGCSNFRIRNSIHPDVAFSVPAERAHFRFFLICLAAARCRSALGDESYSTGAGILATDISG